MSYKRVFGVPIWEFHIDDLQSDRLKLVEWSLDIKQKEAARMEYNTYGSWLSEDIMWRYENKGVEVFSKLNNIIRALVNDAVIPKYENLDKHLKRSSLKRVTTEPHDINVNSSWINISDKHHHVSAHTHPGNWLTGIFYIKVPDDKDQSPWLFDPNSDSIWDDGWKNNDADTIKKGDLYFHNPNSVNTHEPWPYILKGNIISKKPVEGKLVIWPSWLPYGFKPNQATTERISYSFNISYLELKESHKNIVYPHNPTMGEI